jgi:hypothetical protein
MRAMCQGPGVLVHPKHGHICATPDGIGLSEAGTHRDWVFIELARKWYVADQRWKLNESGQLFDLSDAPWTEKAVPADTTDAAALAARTRLAAALAQLNPAGGVLDDGDGTGRHANRTENRAKRKKGDK